MKLTDWIPGSVKPVRVGPYQRQFGIYKMPYSYWNGQFWGLHGMTADEAREYRKNKSSVQDLSWRGLAEKP